MENKSSLYLVVNKQTSKPLLKDIDKKNSGNLRVFQQYSRLRYYLSHYVDDLDNIVIHEYKLSNIIKAKDIVSPERIDYEQEEEN